MKLFIARHGETASNLVGRYMGHLDSPLTDRGLLQAEALAQRLAEQRLDIVYSSDLGRAQRTAEVVAAACGVDLCVDSELRERHMGVFQGLTPTEVSERYPDARKHWASGDLDYVIPGGESARQRTDRSVRVFTTIADRHAAGRVAVVTHGGFLLGFFQHILGLAPGATWRFRRHNGSLSVFGYEEDRWHLETWNDTSHLSHLGDLDELA